jgi:hypothetical protein
MMSLYEVQKLLPAIEKCQIIILYLYASRMHQAYQPLDKLDLFTRGKSMPSNAIPQSLVQQLNMFSGQTYLMGNENLSKLALFWR